MQAHERLRRHAIAQSLFPPTTLKAAVRRLGFVQADPIRSPARAQDLILRHRVKGYRAGDLERRYASLDIEEDFLYAYGFIHRTIWHLLHPRRTPARAALERKVLDVVRRFGPLHPRELEQHFGNARVINAWGGYSKATTHALEYLHYRGLLRIARRDKGIRIYEVVPSRAENLSPVERLRHLVMAVTTLLAPVPEATLRSSLTLYRGLGDLPRVLRALERTGELASESIDGITYLWPRGTIRTDEVPRTVRFLAPFDPVVWDRRRFEHLWGWPYRFEAYTPAAKRLRGYYAMPLLWGDLVIGWANVRVDGDGLNVGLGFVGHRPTDAAFEAELESEVTRLKSFLNIRLNDSP